MIQSIAQSARMPVRPATPGRDGAASKAPVDVVDVGSTAPLEATTSTPSDVAKTARETRQLLTDLTLEKGQDGERVTVSDLIGKLRARAYDQLLLG